MFYDTDRDQDTKDQLIELATSQTEFANAMTHLR